MLAAVEFGTRDECIETNLRHSQLDVGNGCDRWERLAAEATDDEGFTIGTVYCIHTAAFRNARKMFWLSRREKKGTIIHREGILHRTLHQFIQTQTFRIEPYSS